MPKEQLTEKQRLELRALVRQIRSDVFAFYKFDRGGDLGHAIQQLYVFAGEVERLSRNLKEGQGVVGHSTG